MYSIKIWNLRHSVFKGRKEEETLRCREFEARVCTLRLKVLKRKLVWFPTMYFQNKNQNNWMSNQYQPWQQIVIKSQCKKSPRKREKEMLFVQLIRKISVNHVHNLLPLYNNVFIWVGKETENLNLVIFSHGILM